MPQILWPELWVRPEHGGYGIDPLKPPAGLGTVWISSGETPLPEPLWPLPIAGCCPPAIRLKACRRNADKRLHVIHEGIDTRLAHPNPGVSFEVRGVAINRSVPTIAF